MKPFDLEEYLANPTKKLITRDGRKVRRILCTDARSEYPVIALVEDHEGTKDKALSFTKDGKFFSETNDVTDLFFVPAAPEKHQGWVHIYRLDKGCDYIMGASIWPTEEEAERHAESGLVASVKIEWEE